LRTGRSKHDVYAQTGGSVIEVWDELVGLPDWVIDVFDDAEREFGDGVCDLLRRISIRVNGIIATCEQIIADADREIAGIFSALPESLREWADGQQAHFREQLAGLHERVTTTRDDLTNDLADRGAQAVQEVRKRIQELRVAAGGLVGRIEAAIQQFLEDPARFIINGLLELVGIAAGVFWALVDRIQSVIQDIADDPLGFANNLAAAIGQGFQRFFDNFGTHILSGFFGWLFSGLGAVGVTLPGDCSPASLVTFFLQLMGITWERIRGILARHIGEQNMALIERAVELLANLIQMGPSGLFEMIREQLNPRDLIQQVIQAGVEFLVETLITRVAARLVMMFNPAGAILQAIEVIYRILAWIFNNAARIFSLVGTVVNGAAALIAGNISGMAVAVEGALARLIAPVIDFLAGFLGLGALPERIADTIRGFQQWILGIIERAIRAIADRVRTFVQRARAGLGGRDTRTPEEKQRDLDTAVCSIRPQLGTMLERGVSTTVLRARLAAWRVQYGLTSLTYYGRNVVAAINLTVNMYTAEEIAVGRALEPILQRAESRYLQNISNRRRRQLRTAQAQIASGRTPPLRLSQDEAVALYRGLRRGESETRMTRTPRQQYPRQVVVSTEVQGYTARVSDRAAGGDDTVTPQVRTLQDL